MESQTDKAPENDNNERNLSPIEEMTLNIARINAEYFQKQKILIEGAINTCDSEGQS